MPSQQGESAHRTCLGPSQTNETVLRWWGKGERKGGLRENHKVVRLVWPGRRELETQGTRFRRLKKERVRCPEGSGHGPAASRPGDGRWAGKLYVRRRAGGLCPGCRGQVQQADGGSQGKGARTGKKKTPKVSGNLRVTLGGTPTRDPAHEGHV